MSAPLHLALGWHDWLDLFAHYLLMSLMSKPDTRNFFLWYTLIGFLLYFAYGIWNSKLGRGIVVTGTEHVNPTQP